MSNIITIAQSVWMELIRRKDVYIILAMQAFFTLMLTTLDIFGSDVPSSYIMDIGLLLAFLLSIVLAITMASRQFPQEQRSGTIFSMLTKPISRLEFLLGKWMGVTSGLILVNLLSYLIISSVTLTKGYTFEPIVLLQLFCLHSILLAIIAAIAFFFSFFQTQSASTAFTGITTILCYFMVPRIPHLLTFENGWRAVALKIIYFISPHFELFDMRSRVLHGWGSLNAGVFMGTIAYGLLLCTTALALAWLVFRRKIFKRDAAV